VSHYKGVIDWWEIWNEPEGGWCQVCKGSAEDFVKLTEIAVEEGRKANPDAKFVGICCHLPSFGDGEIARMRDQWVVDTIKLGVLKQVDAWSFHYMIGKPEQIFPKLWSLGRTGREIAIPMWNTEETRAVDAYIAERWPTKDKEKRYSDSFMDTYGKETVPVKTGTEQWVKLYVTGLALGVERFFPFVLTFDSSYLRPATPSGIEGDGSLHPCAVAYAIAGFLVDGMKGAGLHRLPGSVRGCLLRDDERSILVVWSEKLVGEDGEEDGSLPHTSYNQIHSIVEGDGEEDGSLPGCSAWAGEVQEVPLNVPGNLSIEVRDLMGNPIDSKGSLRVDSAPVYLIVARKDEARLLDSLGARLLVRPPAEGRKKD